MFALGREMATLVTLAFSSHLDSSSRVSSFSNLARFSTWKGSRSTTLALPPHRGASRTCTMLSVSSWKRYKPVAGGQAKSWAKIRESRREAVLWSNVFFFSSSLMQKFSWKLVQSCTFSRVAAVVRRHLPLSPSELAEGMLELVSLHT